MSSSTAYIKLKNNTSSRVIAQFYHKNSSNGVQSIAWIIEANGISTTELPVYFKTGPGHLSTLDYWFVALHVVSGSSSGTYVSGNSSSSTIESPDWKEDQLQSGDANTHQTFEVSTSSFKINLKSGSTSTSMHRLRDFMPIQHVFVLMLENHSYDNILGFSNIASTTHATTSNFNVVDGRNYPVKKPAPVTMIRDPGHEFKDVLTQLCGPGATYQPGGNYPQIKTANATGFGTSYQGLSPGKGTNLNYKLGATVSPCITTMPDGSVRTAFTRISSSDNKLTVVGPDTHNDTNWGLYPGSSPSITAYSPVSDGWQAAFSANGTTNLWVVQHAAGDTKIPMKAGTSPSIATMLDGKSWRVAFQGASGNLSVYSSTTSAAREISLGMLANTNPSIAALPSNTWLVAFQANTGVLYTYGNSAGTKNLGCKMMVDTSPSLATTSTGDSIIAYQGAEGTLSVYIGGTSASADLKLRMMAGTSPSIATNGEGQWYIAFQTHTGHLCVASKDGQALFTGPKMQEATSPSITAVGDAGWQVAFHDASGAPAILDNQGNDPEPSAVGDIMACFDTPTQLPVIEALAKNFVVCDHWWSSLPGPTWPNRFFAHCASSGGMDDSPSQLAVSESVSFSGYAMPNGSIYDRLNSGRWQGSSQSLSYRFYQDCDWSVDHLLEAMALGTPGVIVANSHSQSLYSDNTGASGGAAGLGWVPQVLGLKGVFPLDFYSMDLFKNDLRAPYDKTYTFIEPHYGNITGDTYKGGSSQHPRDDTHGGEMLLKTVYEQLRNSPLWYTSVLIVTYDEHGGFYDSCPPPANTATPPGDGGLEGNEHGFNFHQYGVRVPALVISPQVSPGVSHLTYDHASIPKTLESCFSLPSMTGRDRTANGVNGLCTLSAAANTIRTNCPTTLPMPVKQIQVAAPEPVDGSASALPPELANEALPTKGNLIGALNILVKVALDLSDGSDEARTRILAEYHAIVTREDAARYGEKIWAQILEARARQAALAADTDD